MGLSTERNGDNVEIVVILVDLTVNPLGRGKDLHGPTTCSTSTYYRVTPLNFRQLGSYFLDLNQKL
jgi:hypothetical protein